MTKRNRKTLSAYFADGQLPTQEAFGDLIDSVVNIVDDGFDKTPEEGMKIAQLDNRSKLVGFYDEITVKAPLWSIAFSVSGYGGNVENNKNLNFFYGNNKATGLTLASAPETVVGPGKSTEGKIRVGINKNDPEHELDIDGVIAADGRIGRAGTMEVRADGKWHPVIARLDGCQAFEIMAGVGKPHSGRYALLHAYALSTFNSKKGNITYHQAHFSSRCDQIELRWVGGTHDYSLEMRVRCCYEQNAKEEIYIRYYLTQLWFDPFMTDCVKKDGAKNTTGGA
ncbi:MAG: hypothetical protein M0P59_00300 [Gallionella sp.]|jgi:hypothetical protein|nr:hypothetical protein [Gallionella sp.]MCK9352580.1 hypothetical protein [Gallionella sp.]